ncbi:MAG: hypothetical protein KBC35_00110 [Candidatus Pacebacteria bacterium]|nr:hypothetical protein [Candidatus Paceibacterota bacterium]
MKEHNEQNKPLRDSLLKRIESENVCPHSRLFFQGREMMVWSLWLLSVVVGSFAIAVTMFVVVHGQYAFYEATHENFLTFIVEALPYLWIVTFAVMVYAAVYNIRHTKRGYKYPLWMIMTSSVVLSFAGGSALQLFGFGYDLDELFGRHMMLYTSQQKFEQRLWQDPDEGRLLGVQTYTTLSPTTTVIFKDVEGRTWTMNISELPIQDREVLGMERVVRLIGKATSDVPRQFHVCGVFPWVHERDLSAREMDEQRQRFIERVSEHARKADEMRRFDLQELSFASTTIPAESICATIAPVRRMPMPPRM